MEALSVDEVEAAVMEQMTSSDECVPTRSAATRIGIESGA
jgi:hypothetical protein